VAPRAYWKGYLKLSLVSCPVALFPASSEREKISFHQINKKTGNRIKYRRVDAETGDEVDPSDIVKGYEVGKGEYIEVEPEELEAIAIESKRTIEIDEFVPKKEIDELYVNSPYYIVPDGEVGQQAFAVIREAIRKEGMVALARVVFTSREHVIALEPRGKGLLGVTLRQERASQPKSSVLWMRFAEAWTQSVAAAGAGKQNGVQHSAALRRKPADHLRGRRRPADSRSERAYRFPKTSADVALPPMPMSWWPTFMTVCW